MYLTLAVKRRNAKEEEKLKKEIMNDYCRRCIKECTETKVW